MFSFSRPQCQEQLTPYQTGEAGSSWLPICCDTESLPWLWTLLCLSVPLKLPRMMSQAYSTPVPHTGLLPNTCQVATFILNPYPLWTHGDSIMLIFFFLPDYLRNFTPAQVAPFLRHPQAHGCLDKSLCEAGGCTKAVLRRAALSLRSRQI